MVKCLLGKHEKPSLFDFQNPFKKLGLIIITLLYNYYIYIYYITREVGRLLYPSTREVGRFLGPSGQAA